MMEIDNLWKPEIEYRMHPKGRPMDRKDIYAHALDAANQHMRDNGRKDWNDEDCQIYADKYWKLAEIVYPSFIARVRSAEKLK